MKVLFDTNVWISYLLSPEQTSPIVALVDAAVERFPLVVPPPLMDELRQIREKPRLRTRIRTEQVEHLIEILTAIGEVPTLSAEEMQSISRNAKDDYLIAYGLVAGADYLVSGDKDLVVLDKVDTLRIVPGSQFRAMLQAEGIL
jgi:uncharacterized protein